jgi:hypothetical protein
MAKWMLIGGVALLVALIAAAIVPMWVMSAGMGMSGAGWAAVLLMVLFCFVVGGGLMFLIFYSARQGYDEAVYRTGASPSRDDVTPSGPASSSGSSR